MQHAIRPYRESDERAVVRLSLRAWAPVHDSMKDVMGEEIFQRLYAEDSAASAAARRREGVARREDPSLGG